jgi:hypothetical protein
MIDERPSLEAAAKVSRSDLSAYLRSTGWHPSSSGSKRSSVFSIDVPGADETIYLLLPGLSGAGDERRRIADALRTLAALEERDVVEISQQINAKGAVQSGAIRANRTNARSYSRGTHPISAIDGLSSSAAAKLKSLGIRTTEGLLEAAGSVKGRKELAAKTGISEQQLLQWANIADYMRIPGMGKAKAGLLRAAGVTTVRELALREPTRLAQNLKAVNSKRKLVHVLPSEKSVEQLIAKARKLPLKLTY